MTGNGRLKQSDLNAHDTPSTLVALRAITVTYPGRDHDGSIEVLKGITLAVDRGELVVVAGRSGSGKTTLLNVAAGLLRPTGGIVLWSGQGIDELSRDDVARRRGRFVGIVFQNAALIEILTATENVAVGGVPMGLRLGRDRALELLEEFGLGLRAAQFPANLSGGEQQRVALARALFADPPLLIVDEPTANLDRHTADDLIGRLRHLSDEGRGILVASHDLHLIGAADRVVELEDAAQ